MRRIDVPISRRALVFGGFASWSMFSADGVLSVSAKTTGPSVPKAQWSASFPTATFQEEQGGFLIVGNDEEKRLSLVDPANGKVLIESRTQREQVRVLKGLLVTARPEAPSDEYMGQGDWIIEARPIDSAETSFSLAVRGRPRLGDVDNGLLYYTDHQGLHRVNLEGEPRSEPLFDNLAPHWRFFVRAGRIYYTPDGHRIFGMLTTDPKRGWWNYCDCAPVTADEDGVYGTGTCSYGVIAIGHDGREFWRENTTLSFDPSDRFHLNRESLAVSGDLLVIGGRALRPSASGRGPQVVSPYLLAFHKRSGKLLWKSPMEVDRVRIAGSRVVVWAGHYHGNRNNPTPDWRLEVRSAKSGALLWRDKRNRSQPAPLVSIGRRFFLLDRGVLTAYE